MAAFLRKWWDKTVKLYKRCKVFVSRYVCKPILKLSTSLRKRWRKISLAVLFTLITGIVVGSIWFHEEIWSFPSKYYDRNTVGIDPAKLEETKFKFVYEKREKIIIGYLVFLGGILTVWRTIELYRQNKNTERNIQTSKENNDNNLRVTEKNIKIVKENNDNNLLMTQFAKASELLMNDNIAGRLTGIYLFEKIMNSSKEYHWTIIELLTAFVREKRNLDKYIVKEEQGSGNEGDTIIINADKNNNTTKELLTIIDDEGNEITYEAITVEKDIQAIITVLGRRKTTDFETLADYMKNYLDLSKTNLHRADFSKNGGGNSGNYKHFNFSNSVLVLTNCYFADFDLAYCGDAHFEHAYCGDAHFDKAYCENAYFVNAICTNAYFVNAICTGTHFVLTKCEDAHFDGAQCINSNFWRATGLTVEQLSKAETLHGIENLDVEIMEVLEKEHPHLFDEIP